MEMSDLDDIRHVAQIVQDIAKGDDRTTGIVGGAFAENILEQWLRSVLSHGDKESLEWLFRPESPLGSFRAKIDLCFALGIIGPISHKDLHYMREIRNKFAHKTLMRNDRNELTSVSFKTQQIAAWCEN